MATIDVGDVSFEAISPALDSAFTALYEAVQAGAPAHGQAVHAEALAFLAKSTSVQDHDTYFGNFTPLWQLHLRSQRFEAAAGVWPVALAPALEVEKSASFRIHKGTPYYFWGMTALLADKLDVGYLLMHRAFEEDVRTYGSSAPNTPGWALLTLDHQRPDQAFRQWVQHQAQLVEQRIARFCKSSGRTFDLSALRRRFLAKPQHRETVQLYCYTMARVARLLKLPAELWEGPFPAQVAFDSLFDLCLAIDATIHASYNADWRFIALAEELSRRTGLGLTRKHLQVVNGQFQTNFAATLQQALSGSLVLPGGVTITGLGVSLAIAYGCRNRGAHSVAAVAVTPHEYDAVIDHLSAIFFLSVDAFHP